jgi:hypothetical protein
MLDPSLGEADFILTSQERMDAMKIQLMKWDKLQNKWHDYYNKKNFKTFRTETNTRTHDLTGEKYLFRTD